MAESPLQSIVGTTKTEAACASLTALANQLGAGRKLPNFNDLCASLGVSKVTLDRALARLEVQGIVVRRHGSGIFVGPRVGQRTIGVAIGQDLFRPAGSPVPRLMFDQVQRHYQARGDAIQPYLDLSPYKDTSRVRAEIQRDVEAKHLDGLILLAAHSPQQHAWFRELSLPVVKARHRHSYGWGVSTDTDHLIDTAVAALAQRGCRRLGLFTHLERRLVRHYGNVKLDRFRQAVARYGATTDMRWCHLPCRDVEEWLPANAPSYEELGHEGARDLLARLERDGEADRPDGLVITDDVMARGTLTALTRAGVSIGTQLQIATQSNRGAGTLLGYEQDVVRLEVDPAALAEKMCAMLDELVDGGRPTTNPAMLRATLRLPGTD